MFPLESKVLVVDDMSSIRGLVRNHLRTMGFKDLSEAEDGEEALKLILKAIGDGVPFDLVISDWNMPKMKGLELLKQVRANPATQQLPFLLLTSESERDQVTEAVLSGVSQYIVKPFSGKIFEDKLKAAYAKHFKS
ncbi:MAG: response regulator [Bdellovibrionia bacterium]